MDPRISRLIDTLPTLTKDDVDIHDYCPICFVDFKTILDDGDSVLKGAELGGITRLAGCRHVFCRNDLIQWIRSWHGSCPTCRHIFLSNLHPDSESDDESDGGEYVPNEHEEFEDEDEDESFSFDPDPEDPEDEDPEAFGEEELFEEEDDHAMGLRMTDADFYGPDEELVIEAAAARQEVYVEEHVQTAEAIAARIEAEWQDDEVVGFAEDFSYDEALAAEEEERRELEVYFRQQAEECTDLDEPGDIDAEDLRFCIADFQPENEVLEEDIREEVGLLSNHLDEEVDVGAYEEFDEII